MSKPKWLTISNWHLTKEIAESFARQMKKNTHPSRHYQYRVVKHKNWCVQVLEET